MFSTLAAIGTIILLAFLAAIIVSWIFKLPLVNFVSKHSTLLLRVIFIGAVIGSLIFSEILQFPACILCWYQRLAIFPVAIIMLTGTIQNPLIRKQVLLLSSLGFLVALFHNYIDIFPTGIDVCGTSGVSCTARYVWEFGFVTIPLMSGAVLLSGILIALISKRFPQQNLPKA